MQQLSGFLSIKEICEWKCSDCGLDVELEGGAARVCSIYAQTSSLQSSLAEIVIMGDIQKEKKTLRKLNSQALWSAAFLFAFFIFLRAKKK